MSDHVIAPRLLRRLDRLSPEGYNFGWHIRYSRPTYVRLTYRPDWSETYSDRKFILNDPAVVWPLMNTGAIRWSEIDLPDPLGVFEAAAGFGYRYGVAIGCGGIENRSLGSCGRGDREFTDAEIAEIHDTVVEIHRLLEARGNLTANQCDALQMLREGFTYDQSCHHLGISRTAFRARLSSARRNLGAQTNSEAVRTAIDRGILTSREYAGISKGLPSGWEH